MNFRHLPPCGYSYKDKYVFYATLHKCSFSYTAVATYAMAGNDTF